MSDECRVIQVTNVAPTATKDQMKTLFSYIGKIDEIVLYPTTETANCSRVCFVKFADPENVGVSLHLSNTVFIDRALIVMPVPDGKIPDEKTALGAQSASTGLYAGLGNYPSLPESTELSKVDEIRRTVYVSNIDQSITAEMLLQLFAQAGEVKYVRMAGDDTYSIRGAFIEFSEQISVMRALALTGQTVGDRPIRVAPANTAITKPTPAVLMGATSKEIDDAMRKVNEAQPLISAVLDSDSKRHHSRSRSRSRRSRSHRSRSRRRSRSRSRSHRSRSHRSRSRRRSRSRSSRRSRSPKRRRSRSPRRHRSRSRSRHRRHRSRSPITSRSHRSRSREKSSRKKSRSKSRGTTPPDKDKRKSNRDVDRVKKESSSGSPRHRSSRSPHKSTKKRSRSRSRSESRASKRERGRDRKRDDSGERERNERKSKRCKEDGDGPSSDKDDDVLRANLGRNSDDDHEPVSMSMSDGNESD